MSEEKWISEYHGMELQPVAEPDKRHNENGILFLSYYYTLKYILGKLRHSDIAKFQIITENITTYRADGNKIQGLYDRGAGESMLKKEDIRTISHDNLTAIACFSKLMESEGLAYHKKIREHGSKNMWRFDNVYPEKPRWSRLMHPRDVVFWSYISGQFWAKLFIWYPILEMIYTCYRMKEGRPRLHEKFINFIKTRKWQKTETYLVPTSGKLLSFLRLISIKDKFVGKISWRICSWLISKNFSNGWVDVFQIYFQEKDHPINKLARKAKEEGKV